jgi:hypothetical protein
MAALPAVSAVRPPAIKPALVMLRLLIPPASAASDPPTLWKRRSGSLFLRGSLTAAPPVLPVYGPPW